MDIKDEPTVKDYYQVRQQLETYRKDLRDVITHPNYCLQFLQQGRMVKIKFKEFDFNWGAVVNVTPRKASKGEVLAPQQSFVVDVIMPIAADARFAPQADDGLPAGVRPPAAGEEGKMEVVPVLLSCIDAIGHLRLFMPDDLKSTEKKNNVRKSLNEVEKRFPDGVAILDPIENMGIKDESFKSLLRVSWSRIFHHMVLTMTAYRSA